MSETRSLAVFVRVADLGSFAAAARDLGMSPAMVGNHIRALETRFSAPLLLRTTRQQSLTDTGREILARARSLLAEMASLDDIAAGLAEPSGPVRISAPLALGRHHVAPVLHALARQHPKLQIELRLSDTPEDIVKAGLDLVVRNGPLTGSESSLVARVVARQTMLMAAAPSYLETAGIPRTLDELQTHRLLRYGRYGRPRGWLFPTDGGLMQLDPPTGFMVDDLESLCDAALEGSGIIWLPEWMLWRHLAEGRLVPVLPPQKPFVMETYIIRANTSHVPRRVQIAADFLVQKSRAG